MALKPCRECKRKVSTDAESCPQCGATMPTSPRAAPKGKPSPAPKKNGTAWFLILGTIALCIVMFNLSPGSSCHPSTSPVPSSAAGQAAAVGNDQRENVPAGKSEGVVASKVGQSPVGVESAASPKVPERNLDIRFLKKEVDKSPGQTRVEMRVIVPTDSKRVELDRLMQSLYLAALADHSGGNRGVPIEVFAYFYHSEKLAKDAPDQWVCSIQKPAASAGPKFHNNANDDLPETLAAPPGGDEIPAADLNTRVAFDSASGTLTVAMHHTETVDGKEVYARSASTKVSWVEIFHHITTAMTEQPSLGRTTVIVRHKDKTLVRLSVSRATWEKMDYDGEWSADQREHARLMGLTGAKRLSDKQIAAWEVKSEKAFHRRLLARVPVAEKLVASGQAP